MVDSEQVLGKSRIRASFENLSGRVPKNARIRVSTEKLSGLVRKNSRISVSTGKLLNPGEYREKLESVRVPKTVRTSTEK